MVCRTGPVGSGTSLAVRLPPTVITTVSPRAAFFTWLLRSLLSSLMPISIIATVYTRYTAARTDQSELEELEDAFEPESEVLEELDPEPESEPELDEDPESDEPEDPESEPLSFLADSAAALALLPLRVP